MIKIRRSDVSFEIRTEKGLAVMSISGQLNAFTLRDLKAEFKELMDARHYKLVLDLEKVNYVDSYGIGAIIAFTHQVRNRNGDLKLFGMEEDVRKVFDLLGTSKVLGIFETEQEAINSFS